MSAFTMNAPPFSSPPSFTPSKQPANPPTASTPRNPSLWFSQPLRRIFTSGTASARASSEPSTPSSANDSSASLSSISTAPPPTYSPIQTAPKPSPPPAYEVSVAAARPPTPSTRNRLLVTPSMASDGYVGERWAGSKERIEEVARETDGEGSCWGNWCSGWYKMDETVSTPWVAYYVF